MKNQNYKYKGSIYSKDLQDYGKKYNLPEKALFVVNGFWIGYGNREISSYVICNENGDALPEYEHIQFSRDKKNTFYIETID